MLVEEGKLAWDDRVGNRLPWFRLSDPLADREVRCATWSVIAPAWPATTCSGIAPLVHRRGRSPAGPICRWPGRSARPSSTTASPSPRPAWPPPAPPTRPGADLVRKRLFAPLGMKRTCLDAAEADRSDRAGGHRLDRAGDRKRCRRRRRFAGPTPPARSTPAPATWSRWLRFHLDEGTVNGKRLVAARALRLTHTPQMVLAMSAARSRLFPDTVQSSYAMAWVVLDHKGRALIAHGGARMASAPRCPGTRSKLGIAVLSNLHQTPMNAALAFTLLEAVLDLPRKRDWNAIHQADSQAPVGRYMGEDANSGRPAAITAPRRRGSWPPMPAPTSIPPLGRSPAGAARPAPLGIARPARAAEATRLRHVHPAERAGQRGRRGLLARQRGAVRRFHVSGNFNVDFSRGARHPDPRQTRPLMPANKIRLLLGLAVIATLLVLAFGLWVHWPGSRASTTDCRRCIVR